MSINRLTVKLLELRNALYHMVSHTLKGRHIVKQTGAKKKKIFMCFKCLLNAVQYWLYIVFLLNIKRSKQKSLFKPKNTTFTVLSSVFLCLLPRHFAWKNDQRVNNPCHSHSSHHVTIFHLILLRQC